MPGPVDASYLLGLFGQIASSPSMKKMAELKAQAQKHGFEEKLVDDLVPAVTRFIVEAQTRDKLGEAAEFIANVMASASEFGPEMAKILEMIAGPQKPGGG
jgi:hypothetical protein